MLEFNWPAILASGLIPLLVGGIYYNPKVLGNAWMKASGLDEARLKGANMTKIFGFTLLLGLLLSVFFMPVVLHAIHVFSLVSPEGGGQAVPGTPEVQDALAFLEKYGDNFRTFKHGAFHGIIAALFCVWPVLGIVALFERKGWKYTAIHLGYWVITFALMGGVVCAYGAV